MTVSNSANSYTIQGSPITGLASLTKTGLGSLTLASTNTYQGGTFITGGTLTVSAGDGSLGNPSGAITLDNGGTLAPAAVALNTGRNITVNSGGGTINTNSLSCSASGNVAVNGPFTVAGGGNLALTGNVTTASTSAPLLIASGSTLTIGGAAGTEQDFLESGGTLNGNLVVDAPVRFDFSNAAYGGTGEVQLSYSGSIVGNGSDTAPAVPVPGPCCPTPGPAAR